MATGLYVMPIVGAGTHDDPRRPKYRDTDLTGLPSSMADYGNEPWCFVGVPNIPPATDTALQAHPDVFALPANLDQTMGTTGQRNTVRSKLEAVNMPGTWVQTTDTWRTVARFVLACCQISQRYQGLTAFADNWFQGAITLDSLMSALPAASQTALQTTAASAWRTTAGQTIHFDTSVVVPTQPMRAILLSLGNQYIAAGCPLDLAGPI